MVQACSFLTLVDFIFFIKIGLFQLNNVLFIPKLHKPLFSIRQLSKDNNCFFELDRCGFRVKDIQTREILLYSNSCGGLYQLTLSPNTSHSLVALLGEWSTPDTWHDRLRNPSPNILVFFATSLSYQ